MEPNSAIAQHREQMQEDAAGAGVSKLCHGCSIACVRVREMKRRFQRKVRRYGCNTPTAARQFASYD